MSHRFGRRRVTSKNPKSHQGEDLKSYKQIEEIIEESLKIIEQRCKILKQSPNRGNMRKVIKKTKQIFEQVGTSSTKVEQIIDKTRKKHRTNMK